MQYLTEIRYFSSEDFRHHQEHNFLLLIKFVPGHFHPYTKHSASSHLICLLLNHHLFLPKFSLIPTRLSVWPQAGTSTGTWWGHQGIKSWRQQLTLRPLPPVSAFYHESLLIQASCWQAQSCTSLPYETGRYLCGDDVNKFKVNHLQIQCPSTG